MVLVETGSGLSFFFSFAAAAETTGLAAQTQTTVTAHGLSSLSFFSAAAETITATAAVCAKHNEKKLYLHKQIQL